MVVEPSWFQLEDVENPHSGATTASTTNSTFNYVRDIAAAQVNTFCQDFLNPYVNFHRPCFFAETLTDPKGKVRKRYRLKNMMTPYEKLKSRPKAKDFLKPGNTFAQLNSFAAAMSDNEAARRLNEARTKLFQSIHDRSQHAA